MAKLKEAWIGLHKGASGTYIRPTFPGYEYGRWSRQFIGSYRFDHLGDAPTVEAAREGLERADKAVEARTRQLNTRRKA